MQSRTPVRLNIEQARNQAKDLLKAFKSCDRVAARRFRTAIPQLGASSDQDVFSAKLALHDAQRVIAIEHGCRSWPELVAHVQHSAEPRYSVDDLIGFFEAVKNRDADSVRRALDAHPALIDARLLDLNYMLEGDAFREAIRDDPHPVSRKTRTALHLVSTGFFRQATPEVLEVARVLVERGSDVNNLGWDGNNNLCAPITLASWEGGLDMMRLLLEAGADVSGEHGVAALETAAHHDSIDRYNLLEEYGAPVTAWSLIEMGLTDRIIQLVERDPGLLTQRDDSGYTLLQTAAARGDSNPALLESGREIVRALVRRGAEMDAFTAAAMNDVESLSRILDSDPGMADSRLTNGTNPVCFAAWSVSHQALAMLLKAGADPNVSYGNAMSPLRRAALYDDTESCRLLLEHGAVPSDLAVNAAAWRNKDPECVKVLLDYGGNPNPGGDGFGAINWAAWAAQTEAVKALLKRGADPNHRATEWAVGGPLHFAAFAGSRAPADRVAETVKALLGAGSDVNLVDDNGNTPLDAAITRENHTAADLLREHGGKTGRELKEINMDITSRVERFKRHWTIGDAEIAELTANEQLLIAAAVGEDPKRWDAEHTPDVELVREILAEEPAALDRIGEHLLQAVIDKRGCGEVARLLLERGTPFEIEQDSYNVLHNAAYRGASDTLQAVFESGVADATCVSVEKPHVGWPDNLSLMYWAAVPGRVEVAKLLIQYGVGIHHEMPIKGNGERGTTSLHEALAPSQWGDKLRTDGKREVARILIEDGAFYDAYSACALNDTARLQELIDEDSNIVDATEDYDMTPLHWAARAGSMECAEVLLERGALVNPLNKARRTPLQLAAETDQAEMIRLLARHGADLNTQDRKGRTPLHRATYQGCVEAAEALLEMGADPSILNKSGKTAFQIARKDAKYFKEQRIRRDQMDTTKAVARFEKNWFLRDVELPDLTEAERQLITTAMGPEPKRWDGRPDVERMTEILAENPHALHRIGEHLLQVVVGMKGCGPAVKFLLDNGVPYEIDESAYNTLHEAAWGGMHDTLKAVFESGAADATCVSVLKPHVGWPDNVSLMYWAAVGGYVECAKLLIEYGVGVHHELPIKGNGERGTTSLQEAVAPSHWGKDPARLADRLAVAKILIADGAYYDAYSACALNDTSRLKELIDEDPKVVDTTDDYGMTSLHWAARAGSMECAEILLERGVLVNPLNKVRRTPLQLAAEEDQADMIRLLAQHDADLNTQDRKGRTPLHRATYEGCVDAAETLLEVGADPTVLNKSGKTAFEIARKDAKYFKTRA